MIFFFFQAEDGIRDADVTGVQTCALPIYGPNSFSHRICQHIAQLSKIQLARLTLSSFRFPEGTNLTTLSHNPRLNRERVTRKIIEESPTALDRGTHP